jgi:hypothetical protein
MQITSLSAYCKRHNLPKASVHKFLKGEEFDTSEGMGAEAIVAADAYFLDAPPPEPTPAAVTPEIVVGNHRGELALPSQPTHIDLSTYRGEHAALTSFQPEDISRFLESCDGFLDAVEADFAHQQAITQQKEQAAALVKAKVDAVKQASLSRSKTHAVTHAVIGRYTARTSGKCRSTTWRMKESMVLSGNRS